MSCVGAGFFIENRLRFYFISKNVVNRTCPIKRKTTPARPQRQENQARIDWSPVPINVLRCGCHNSVRPAELREGFAHLGRSAFATHRPLIGNVGAKILQHFHGLAISFRLPCKVVGSRGLYKTGCGPGIRFSVAGGKRGARRCRIMVSR